MKNNYFLKITFSALLGLLSLVYFALAESAPDFLVTWKADNFAPAEYRGKVFPSDGTPVAISFEMVDLESGRIEDLSKTKIQWLVNNKTVQSGTGLKNIRFTAEARRSFQEVLITVVNYKNAGSDIQKLAFIPTATPFVILDLPHPDRRLIGDINIFRVLPYFFNIKKSADLRFTWILSGELVSSAEGNLSAVNLNASDSSPGEAISVKVNVTNTTRSEESVDRMIVLQTQ